MLRISLLLLALLACLSPLYAAEGTDLERDNIVIVLDASGSMNQPMGGSGQRKIDAAKQALKQVLQSVANKTQVGLLVFSASNTQNDWVYPLAPLEMERMRKAVDLPKPQGSTPLGRYIKQGVDRLLEQRKAQHGYGTYRLLIVTDGEAQDKALVERYTPEAMARGIVIDVIGVDMNQAHTLSRMSNSYRRADDPQALQAALKEIFAEVGGQGSDGDLAALFSEIAPLPPEMAAAALETLSALENAPLGAMATQANPPTTAPSTPGPASPGQGATTAPSSPDAQTDSILGILVGGFCCCMLPLLLLIVVVFMVAKKKKS